MPRLCAVTGRAGMTLIELLVVLALIGILLAASTLAIGAALERRAPPAERLGELASRARVEAARRGEPVRLRLPAPGRYELVAPHSRALIEEGSVPLPAMRPLPFTVTFYPAGTSSGGALCIRTERGWERLEFDRVTGGPQPSTCTTCCPDR